jgi:hypothetical protein
MEDILTLPEDGRNIFKQMVSRKIMLNYFDSMAIDDEVYIVVSTVKGKDSLAAKIFITKPENDESVYGICKVFSNSNDANDYLDILEASGLAHRVTTKIVPLKIDEIVKLLIKTDDLAYQETGLGIRAETYTVINGVFEKIDIFWTRELDYKN